jgi:hypothetical protein
MGATAGEQRQPRRDLPRQRIEHPVGHGIRGKCRHGVSSDGSILFVVFKTAQTAAVYRLRGPGRMELLGTIPRPVSHVSIANDLDRALVTARDYHADAWMVRILQR